MAKTSGDHQRQILGMVYENPSMGLILEAFKKHSIRANNLVNLKHGQEKTVNHLSQGRNVLAVTPTGYAW